MKTLTAVKIAGFKFIRQTRISFNDVNVVIGANGSGKSNLIGAFRLLERILSQNLQLYVAGDPDRILFHGRKTTPSLSADFQFSHSSYAFSLEAQNDILFFTDESIEYEDLHSSDFAHSKGHKESRLSNEPLYSDQNFIKHTFSVIRDSAVYHFHDTSDSSPAKAPSRLEDNHVLRRDASNLAAFLYWMQVKHPVSFRQLEEHIRLVAPFFDRFTLAPSRLNPNQISLTWRQSGSDAYSLSDGSLRFICLAALLLQPEPPGLILLDEPELGLHPTAIHILADMIRSVSVSSQVILATQSVTLLDQFTANDVIVAENDGSETIFRRLDDSSLDEWKNAFSLGELWEKNVLGGRP